MNSNVEIIQDYRLLRLVGLALATIAFLVGLAKLGAHDQPHEYSKAQGLIIKAAVIFLFLAGDRMLMRGLASWFGLPLTSLPVFWQ